MRKIYIKPLTEVCGYKVECQILAGSDILANGEVQDSNGDVVNTEDANGNFEYDGYDDGNGTAGAKGLLNLW